MNRARMLELRSAVEQWPPEQFDYRSLGHFTAIKPAPLLCGCVSYIAHTIWPEEGFDKLGLPYNERAYLYGSERSTVGPGKSYVDMTDAEATGEAGIAEALRRIDLLLAREDNNHD